MPSRHHVRVAAVQPRGYPFDSAAAIEHVCSATAEAAANGAELVIFPEAFVGGYPWGLAFGTAVGGRKPAGRRTFGRYHDDAIPVPGPETERMGRAGESLAARRYSWERVATDVEALYEEVVGRRPRRETSPARTAAE